MTCTETIQAYAFRSLGFGERLLPREGYDLCQQFTLIGSGLIWNVYFAVVTLALGFFLAIGLAMGKDSRHVWIRTPCDWFVFVFRGSPLFIQFFVAYQLLVLLPRDGITVPLGLFDLHIGTDWMTRAWAGAALVLFFNTAAYTAEIFLGALRSIPKGDLEAADAYGINGWSRFRRIRFPTMMRLAWPAYTNEAIFLFHATTLVFFSGFPAFQQRGDALYYASYFAGRTFNPFVPYPIVAFYFICLTLLLTWVFGRIGRRLNRHLPSNERARRKPRFLPQIIR
ncbi:ABC transporter permease [Falsirhodobacter sp. 20TX0035]|uniref:ABC transporter permease n=1 Tax=Falsirhodobacter sp. 20TX0035 TaxID=3022019 RepID=UPI00232BFE18|nr:ABC transporter permease subunit [Falsirhodobacter sp. 20TX0035]MDB6452058.1 ABC transporter permease subunit [Falsirhodobacter sp. 20TX0035]